MRLLREQRGMTRWKAIRFGLKWRANQIGVFQAAAVTLSIVLADMVRQTVRSSLRFGLILPARLLSIAAATVGNMLSIKRQASNEKEVSL